MIFQPEEVVSNIFVPKHGMVETATSLDYVAVEYVHDDVKIRWKTEGALPVLGRRRKYVLMSRRRLPGY